jgi:hypothetical protein
MNKLILSNESKLLFKYYTEIQKISKNKIIFPSQKREKNLYYDFHKYLYKKYQDLYKKIKNDYCNCDFTNYLKIYNNSSKKYKDYIKNIYIKHLQNNKYISENIKNYIKTGKNGQLISYEFPTPNNIIQINFVIYNPISQKYISHLSKKVENMLINIFLIKLLSNNNCNNKILGHDICSSQGLTINILCTPFKRTIEILNNDENVLGANNVNGGFCYGCTNAGEIVVYRSEEWFKVFTHELIHNYGVDHYIFEYMKEVKSNNNDYFRSYKKFINNFNLSREININENNIFKIFDIGLQESIVEYWGEFFNNAIFCFNYGLNPFNVYYKNFHNIMNLEIIHGYFQSTKILKKNNMNFNVLLSKNKSLNEQNKYKERTHIFSYYILKLFLLNNYKSLVNIFIKKSDLINIKDEYRLQLDKNIETIDKIFSNILDSAHSNEVLNNFILFDKIFTYIRDTYYYNIKKKMDDDLIFLIANLRMSILEHSRY